MGEAMATRKYEVTNENFVFYYFGRLVKDEAWANIFINKVFFLRSADQRPGLSYNHHNFRLFKKQLVLKFYI